MKNLSTKEFCEKYNACSDIAEFAKDYPDTRSCYQALLDGKAEENSRAWALWVFSHAADEKTRMLYAIRYARRVEHLMKDERSRKALDVAERYANGLATEAELREVQKAAECALYSAHASCITYASNAYYAAAYADTYDACLAASNAASAAYYTVHASTHAVAAVACHAAASAASAAERAAQLERLREIGNVFGEETEKEAK